MKLFNRSFISILIFLAPHATEASRPEQCNNLAQLNFDSLSAGDYITTQLRAEFGVTVRAALRNGAGSGFTPNNAARVFDTSNPLAAAPNDDLDLGSPNEDCPGGGPGIGAGGAPGSPYENCIPLGNVLVIQEEDTVEPDDNFAGGFLIFKFSDNVYVDTVTLFDIDDEGDTFVEAIQVIDGVRSTTRFESPVATGDNAVIPVAIDMPDVATLRVYFAGSGALAGIDFFECAEETEEPTSMPTPLPTKAPTSMPTPVPTPVPTPMPTPLPTKAPTSMPTPVPTPMPTPLPTKAPTSMPTPVPTPMPTPLPTDAPAPAFPCVFPPSWSRFSLITLRDAIVGAHNMYTGIAIGGVLTDGSPGQNAVVDRTRSYLAQSHQPRDFNFNGGLTLNAPLSNQVDWANYEWLAKNLKSSTHGHYRVLVFNHGGTFDLGILNDPNAQPQGKPTLFVFNTYDDVTLTNWHGRQFGPSVLAPFSKVMAVDAGYIDGSIVAFEYEDRGSGLQLHGKFYDGPLMCV